MLCGVLHELLATRKNIEKERAKNCIFISFLWTRNEEKSGSSVINGKFAKLLCHTEPTLPSAMTVYKY